MTVAVDAGVAGVSSGGPGPAIWLGGRFRLDERITAAGALSLWKATDALLCRPVTIQLLPRGVPVPPYVVAAVQAAARVTDPRLAIIYDTDYSIDGPYIVSEWTPGTHLEDLVLSGLPSPAGVSTVGGAPGGASRRAWLVIASRTPGTPARTCRGV